MPVGLADIAAAAAGARLRVSVQATCARDSERQRKGQKHPCSFSSDIIACPVGVCWCRIPVVRLRLLLLERAVWCKTKNRVRNEAVLQVWACTVLQQRMPGLSSLLLQDTRAGINLICYEPRSVRLETGVQVARSVRMRCWQLPHIARPHTNTSLLDAFLPDRALERRRPQRSVREETCSIPTRKRRAHLRMPDLPDQRRTGTVFQRMKAVAFFEHYHGCECYPALGAKQSSVANMAHKQAELW